MQAEASYAEVFESFITAALSEAMRPHGGWSRSQYVSTLDHGRALKIRPDFTWWKGGRCQAVVDAKYKSLVDRSTMPNADAYQMLAYCIGLGLPAGYLVYAKDSGEARGDHTVKQHGYILGVRTVDVELDPEALLAEVARLADELASMELLATAA